MQDAIIQMILFGYKGWCRNLEANPEGHDGKMLTFLNIAVMSLTKNEWRAAAVAEGLLTQAQASELSVRFLADIDDKTDRADMPLNTIEQSIALANMLKETVVSVRRPSAFRATCS